MTVARTIAAACCIAALCGCGPSHALEGSLSSVLALQYDTVEFNGNNDEFALRFVKKRESGEDTPFKLSYNLSGTAIQRHVDMDLASQRPEGGPRTTLSRDVLDDPRQSFPAVQLGAITFEDLPTSGQHVKGQFHLTFVEGKELGSGRTVFGPFEATVP